MRNGHVMLSEILALPVLEVETQILISPLSARGGSACGGNIDYEWIDYELFQESGQD